MRSAAGTLLALVIGLVVGAAAAASGNETVSAAVSAIEPVGTLWINAIRMTVIPLVVALVITGVASSPDLRPIGRLGARAIPVFLVLLVAGGVFTAVVAPLSLDQLVIPPQVAASLRASVSVGAASAGVREMPSLVQRIVEIVPANPVRAAAEGAMLPLVVFSLAFGIAVTRLTPAQRDPLVRWFQALADAMLVLVGWVLAVAPIGIFALALGLATRMGLGAAGALVHYVATLSAVLLVCTAALYPVAALVGRIPVRRFAAAALPAQAVAFSSRSSLAALPALIKAARERLQLSPTITGFALPLAVSVFRVNVPIAWVVGVQFLGKLYGIPVGGAELAGLVVTSTLISFSVPGIPSSSLFLLAPVLVGMGLPAEGVGILIAVDAIPDIFKTTVNVTSHLTAAAVLARVEAPRRAETT
ncbi:MAG: dicarboxylate/amino acid:cation symporter [Gemmatimonadales bacterium]